MKKDFSLTQIIAIFSGFAVVGIVVGFGMIQLSKDSDLPPLEDPPLKEEPIQIASSLTQMPPYNKFAFDLFLDIAYASSETFGFSPYGAYSTLTAVAYGADNETEQQLLSALGIINHNKNTVLETNFLFREHLLKDSIFNASSFLVKTGAIINEQHKLLTEKYFAIKISEMPSSGRDTNSWFYANTNGQIEQVMTPGPISPLLSSYLINAFALTVQWDDVLFFEQSTVESFYAEEGAVTSSIGVFAGNVGYFSGETAILISIDDKKKNYTSYIIIPEEKLSSFYQSFTLAGFQEEKSQLQNTNIRIKMPTISFDNTLQLEENIRGVNILNALSPSLADFSKMIDVYEEEPVYINSFMQRVDVSVSVGGEEKGSVINEDVQTISLNRPFVFIVEEKVTGNIIFMGQITSPVE